MSFILDALKKSEQQRQQQGVSPQQVRRRTLSLSSRQSRFGLYWLLTAILLFLTFCGWWFYHSVGIPTPSLVAPQAVVENQVASVVPQPEVTEPAVKVAMENAQQQVVAPAEPAPVPREVFFPASPTPADSQPRPATTRVQARQVNSSPPVEPKHSALVPTEVLSSVGPKVAETFPLYSDLSGELRARMPRLTMSMHFHATEPSRRLVRINDRLLHEGAWVEQDLQIIEITEKGVILDFVGKRFEMRSQNR